MGYGYMLNKQTIKSFAAETANPDKLHKVTTSLSPTTAENIVDIQFILDQWARDHSGEKWSVVAKSQSGASFDARINADVQYESASMRKLLLAVPLYAQVPLESQKTVQVSHNGALKPMATCVDLMIRLNSDECESLVSSYVDTKKANETLKKAGLHKTTLGAKTQTTAEDMAAYLAYVNGNELPRSAKDTLVKLLKEQQFKKGIPAGCPGCIDANKSDPDETVIHDVAIVNYRGGSYVLSIFTKDGSYSDISLLAGKIQQKILDTTSH